MFRPISTLNIFSVNDLAAARFFYRDILGLQVEEEGVRLILHLPGGGTAFAYAKDDHQPATYTTLGFVVENIEEAVTELQSRGVSFERYAGMSQDEKGIRRGLANRTGLDVAWFLDPAGNILAVFQQV